MVKNKPKAGMTIGEAVALLEEHGLYHTQPRWHASDVTCELCEAARVIVRHYKRETADG